MKIGNYFLCLMMVTSCVAFSQSNVLADTVCLKSRVKKNGKIRLLKKQVSGATCPKGYLALINTDLLQGPAGADGSLRIYGSASASSANYSENAVLAASTMEFNDFTVQSGVTLTVPSGTVLRCYGTFINNGTIKVAYGAEGGFAASDEPPVHAFDRSPHPGISSASAGLNECMGVGTHGAHGGVGGIGITKAAATLLRYPGPNAGGGSGQWGKGGGSFVVLAKSGIVNAGTISADGESELAGGAGGIVILASPLSVINSGQINAIGGTGAAAEGDPDWSIGAGGGGGGGIVHLIAPSVEAGSCSVAGGAGGAENAAAPGDHYCSGAGGGASGGNGGDVVAKRWAASNGSAGHLIVSLTDPTPLF